MFRAASDRPWGGSPVYGRWQSVGHTGRGARRRRRHRQVGATVWDAQQRSRHPRHGETSSVGRLTRTVAQVTSTQGRHRRERGSRRLVRNAATGIALKFHFRNCNYIKLDCYLAYGGTNLQLIQWNLTKKTQLATLSHFYVFSQSHQQYTNNKQIINNNNIWICIFSAVEYKMTCLKVNNDLFQKMWSYRSRPNYIVNSSFHWIHWTLKITARKCNVF